MPLWLNDNKIVIDSSGYPIDCAHCPCDDISDVDCSPCSYWETDHYVHTAKENLTLTYTGFSAGSCAFPQPTVPSVSCDASLLPNCPDSCAAMNSSWTLEHGHFQSDCTWCAAHDLCTMNTWSGISVGAEHFFDSSCLYFSSAIGGSNDHVKLSLQLNGADYSWHIRWEKVVAQPDHPNDPGCLGPDYRDNWCGAADGLCSPPYKPDCSQMGNGDCAVFTAADLASIRWFGIIWTPSVSIPFQNDVFTCSFPGADCPCDVGWAGSVTPASGAGAHHMLNHQITTTSLPGSSITATVTGW